MDGALRVWGALLLRFLTADVPTGRLLWAHVGSPLACIALSPTGDSLVTAMTGMSALGLWAARGLYSAVLPRPLPAGWDPLEPGETTSAPPPVTAAPESAQFGDLLTLSGLSRARWASLPSLAIIRERNKPLQPPTTPVQAPFFLPAIGMSHDVC